jgi:hypothetical protein
VRYNPINHLDLVRQRFRQFSSPSESRTWRVLVTSGRIVPGILTDGLVSGSISCRSYNLIKHGSGKLYKAYIVNCSARSAPFIPVPSFTGAFFSPFGRPCLPFSAVFWALPDCFGFANSFIGRVLLSGSKNNARIMKK